MAYSSIQCGAADRITQYKWRDQDHLMGNKWNLLGLNYMYKKVICISKCELTQAIGVRSMAMWGSIPVKDFIVPVFHLQIGLGNDF